MQISKTHLNDKKNEKELKNIYCLIHKPEFLRPSDLRSMVFSKFIRSESINLIKENSPNDLYSIICAQDMNNKMHFSNSFDSNKLEHIIQIQDPNSIKINVGNHHISKNTNLVALYEKYKFVIAIHLTPSLVSIDLNTGEIAFDKIYDAIEICLREMLNNHIKENSFPFKSEYIPQVFVTIIAEGLLLFNNIKIIIQSLLLTPENIDSTLSKIQQMMPSLENETANCYMEHLKK